MSFFRSEAVAQVTRWVETVIYGALTVGAVNWLWAPPLGATRIVVIVVIGAAGFWLTRAAFLSALAGGPLAAPGVVTIDERRIAYFGPHEGGVISINGLGAIGVDGRGGWHLWAAEGGPPVMIPSTAEGADGLLDAFSALPGFQAAPAVSALRGRETITIWRRADGSDRDGLAPLDRAV